MHPEFARLLLLKRKHRRLRVDRAANAERSGSVTNTTSPGSAAGRILRAIRQFLEAAGRRPA